MNCNKISPKVQSVEIRGSSEIGGGVFRRKMVQGDYDDVGVLRAQDSVYITPEITWNRARECLGEGHTIITVFHRPLVRVFRRTSGCQRTSDGRYQKRIPIELRGALSMQKRLIAGLNQHRAP